MALEATLQMAELTGIPRSKITTLECQKVYITAALIIPDDSRGVEILFSLRRSRIDSHKFHQSLYEFTITSVTATKDGDIFTEHSHGLTGFYLQPKAFQANAVVSSSSAKPILASRWYDTFAQIGLNYGPTFQCMSDITTTNKAREAEAILRLKPTRDSNQHESKYVIHPTSLDGAIQLAVVAAHRGRTSDCTVALLPISFKKIIISSSATESDSARISAHSVPYENGFNSDVLLMDSADTDKILRISGLHCVKAKDINPMHRPTDALPFTRVAWRPDFDLTKSDLIKLYPTQTQTLPTSSSVEPQLSALEQLAMYQIAQFYTTHHKIFLQGSQVPNLQRYLNWMTEKVSLMRRGLIPGGLKALKSSISERDIVMKTLSTTLLESYGPETRLMSHMFNSLPSIFAGEITGIQAAVQNNYLNDIYEFMTLFHNGNLALKDIVVLLSHKSPRISVFEVGGGTGSATREVLCSLRGNKSYRGYKSYTFTDITPSFLAKAQENFKEYAGVEYAVFDMQIPASKQGFETSHDLVIASNVVHATANIRNTLINIRGLLKPGGKLVLFEIIQPTMFWMMILGTFSDVWKGDHDPEFPRTEGPFLTRDMWNDVLPRCGFRLDVDLDHFSQDKLATVIVATAVDSCSPSINLPIDTVSIIYRDTPSPFVSNFYAHLQSSGYGADLIPLSQVKRGSLHGKRVVSLVEIDDPLFLTITECEWTGFQEIAINSGSVLWVTRGNLLGGGDPRYAIISGLVCAIHTENKSSRFLTVDLEIYDVAGEQEQFRKLILLEERATKFLPGDDFEYRSKNGVIHISRLVDDSVLNETTEVLGRSMANGDAPPSKNSEDILADIIDPDSDINHPLDDDSIEVEIRPVKPSEIISRKTLGSISSQFGNGFSGVVTAVGSNTTSFQPCDEVYGLYFGKFSKIVRTKAIFCRKFENSGSFFQIAAAPLAACTAVYGLFDAGSLKRGESILISVTSLPITLMLATIAIHTGAMALVVMASDQQRLKFLELVGKPPHGLQVFSKDMYGAEEAMRPTYDRGVDLIISDTIDGFLHQQFSHLAFLGRVVVFGARDTKLDNDALANNLAEKNATFTSFDLESISKNRPDIIDSLMTRAQNLELNLILPTPTIESISLQDTSSGLSGSDDIVERITAKSAVDENEPFKNKGDPNFNRIQFHPNASYLLVGCLGGLGRSFAKWMVAQGARSFIFLSRSGASNTEAAEFVARLRSLKIDVKVIQGDVTSLSDVQAAVSAANAPIKGVIQAALTLKDSFLHSMTLTDFNTTFEPRVKGTMNLHQVLENISLDFFVMWSSWTKMIGSASQANYMASSAFMDAFAVHRRKLGLPATSLTLGHILDVGIVSDHLAWQQNVLRMGMYGNSEDEFLRYCETSVLSGTSQSSESFEQGHLLAGLEPAGLLLNNARYPVVDMTWYQDPRFSFLLGAYQHLASTSTASDSRVDIYDDNVQESLLMRIHARVARALYVAVEDIDITKPINSYGIDSMVAAEVRNWLFQALGVNISLLNLLHPTLTIEKLAEKGTLGSMAYQP
ncbi:hypothetical protein ACMFMF_003585 [Clarireedia jacksonii]